MDESTQVVIMEDDQKNIKNNYQILENKNITNRFYENEVISGSLFSLVTFNNVTFNNCTFFGSNLENCIFINCKIAGCNFKFTNIVHCDFVECNFNQNEWTVSSVNKNKLIDCEFDERTEFFIEKEINKIYSSKDKLSKSLKEVSEEEQIPKEYFLKEYLEAA